MRFPNNNNIMKIIIKTKFAYYGFFYHNSFGTNNKKCIMSEIIELHSLETNNLKRRQFLSAFKGCKKEYG